MTMQPPNQTETTDKSETIYDVVIAGAGPIGLFLAHELRRADLSVLVLEKLDDPHSPLKKLPFGMRGLTPPTIEAFYRRDLLDHINETNNASITTLGLTPGRHFGHFAGIHFTQAEVDPSKWSYRLPSPADVNMAVELECVEKVLAKHASARGVVIRRGLGIQGFDQSDDLVNIHTASQTIRARWLVGCDGAHSVVRKLGGFEFIGTDPEFTGYSALVAVADRDKLLPGKNNTTKGMYSLAPTGQLAMADFDKGAARREAITLEHLQAVLRRISNTDVTLAAVHNASLWTDRTAQATTYRNGRVLLAGDAAHVHSPLGGQGLNLGIGDALNLGWKLAATIHGWAPEGLLDTYSAERHPIGVRVLDWSRAQVAVMGPSPASRALEAILRDVMATRDGATYFAERVWGVSLRYDLGASHPLVGRSVPDFEMAGNGMKVGILLRAGKGLLLDFDSRTALRTVGDRWKHRLDYVVGDVKERLGLSSVLIRPDGIVAWACEEEPGVDELFRIASRWFGSKPVDSL